MAEPVAVAPGSWWADHDVDARCRGRKRFRQPVVGEIVVHIETLQLHDGGRWLYAYAVEPGSRSEEAMRLLGVWAATQDAEAAADRAPGVRHGIVLRSNHPFPSS